MTARISIVARNTSGATEHKGKTVESIVRRLYGDKAFIRYSADRNPHDVGLIVSPAHKNPGFSVQAKVLWINGDREDDFEF